MKKKPYPGYAWRCEEHNTFGDGNITCAICGYPKSSSTTKGKIEKIKTETVGMGATYPHGTTIAATSKTSGALEQADWVFLEKINEIINRLNELERTKQ